MNFGKAIEALKEGKMVKRSVHGEHEFFFRQVPSTIPASGVPNMTSLPRSVKVELIRRFNDPAMQFDSIHYINQLAFVNSSNMITGWMPSAEDVMADDWQIIE